MSQRLGKAAQALSGPKTTLNLPHLNVPQRLVKRARGMNGSKTTLRPLQFSSTPKLKSRWGFKETKKPYEALPSTLDSLSDIETYLSKPSWSVKSLLKDKEWSDRNIPEVTPKTLHHLLKLSALPQPENEEKENEMLATLRLQLHFVREIQEVDTSGVKPLSAIREETEEAKKEITIGLDSLKEALANEETVGRMRRPRRKTEVPQKIEQTSSMKWEDKIVSDGGFEWAPLSLAMESHRKGQYYYMEYGEFGGDSSSPEVPLAPYVAPHSRGGANAIERKKNWIKAARKAGGTKLIDKIHRNDRWQREEREKARPSEWSSS